MGPAGRRNRSVERYLPLGYFVLALMLALMVLPSILRRPAVATNQSAELSPDAPPDKHQNALVASLNPATSGVAGSTVNEASRLGQPATTTTSAPSVEFKTKGCPFGFGNPPRQTFSVYSPPCALAWQGDNGGATATGVTRDEIRIIVGDPFTAVGTDGPVEQTPSSNQSSSDYTWSVLQKWFNQRYQLWGRHIQLIVANGSEDPQSERNTVDAAVSTYHPFAAEEGRLPAMEEWGRLGVVAAPEEGDQFTESFMSQYRPFLYQWRASIDLTMQMTAELICRYLKDKPAAFAGPALQATPRRFGLLYQDNRVLGQTRSLLEHDLASCGASLAQAVGFTGENEYNSTTQDPQGMGTAIAEMQSAGVTTVIDAVQEYGTQAATSTARTQNYVPEWIVSGTSETDNNNQAAVFSDQTEWAHAFGIGAVQLQNDVSSLADGYQAFHEIDPAGSPDTNITNGVFPGLMQLVNGIQAAGPRLTPATLEQGLIKLGHRPNSPRWSVGGGYGPDKHAFPDDVGIIWWDTTVTNDSGLQGIYRWVAGGRRFGTGHLDIDPGQLFHSGVTTQAEAIRAES